MLRRPAHNWLAEIPARKKPNYLDNGNETRKMIFEWKVDPHAMSIFQDGLFSVPASLGNLKVIRRGFFLRHANF